MQTNIKYRAAQSQDYRGILNLYNRMYSTNRSLSDFTWSVSDNPAGQGIIIIALSGDDVVGVQSLLPYLFLKNGIEILTYKSEDTLVNSDYRGHGVFREMYRLAFELSKGKLIWGITDRNKIFNSVNMKSEDQLTSAVCFNPDLRKSIRTIGDWKTMKGIAYIGLMLRSKIRSLGMKRRSEDTEESTFSYSTNGTIRLGDFINNISMAHPHILFPLINNNFVEWRLFDNPAYKKAYVFVTRDVDAQIIAATLVGIHDHSAVLLSSFFESSLDLEKKETHVRRCTQHLFSTGIGRIDTWHFTGNGYVDSQKGILDRSGFSPIRKGMYIVHNSHLVEVDARELCFSSLLGMR